MKIKIVSVGKSTFWYANQIGSTFNVKESEKHKDDYILDENLVDSVLAILKSDCKVITDEPSFQDGINEGFEAGLWYDGGNSKYVKIIREEYKMLKENQKELDATPQPEPFDLERAMKGERVVTLRGSEGTYVTTISKGRKHPIHIFEITTGPDKDTSWIYCYASNGSYQSGNGLFDQTLSDDLTLDLFMAPKEPEFVEGWVIVDKHGIAPCVYPDVKSASHSAVFNNADRKFKIEKIRFPKP